MFKSIQQRASKALDDSKQNFLSISIIGTLGYSFIYLFWLYALPQVHVHPLFFITSIFLCAILYPTWKLCSERKYHKFFMLLWCAGLLYQLPFLSIYLTLKSGFSDVLLMWSIAGLFFLILLLYDFLLISLFVVTGGLLAFFAANLTGETLDEIQWYQYLIAIIPSLYTGWIFNNRHKKGTVETITAKALVSYRNQLFNAITHDAKTPLSNIRSLLDLVLNDHLQSEESRRLIRLARKSALQCDEILDDVLNISKAKVGQLELNQQPFDFRQTLKTICDQQRIPAQNQSSSLFLNISQDFPYSIIGDKKQIYRIALNLINNAVKFTKKGRITVSLSVLDNKINLEIDDTGKGIAKEQQKTIFAEFEQEKKISSARHSGEGYGVGLFSCQQLIKAMGGEVGLLRSTVGKGSTFYASIPLVTH